MLMMMMMEEEGVLVKKQQQVHQLMLSYLPEIVQIAKQEISTFNLPSFLENDISLLLNYCIEGGKLIRGQIVVQTLLLLAASDSKRQEKDLCSESELRIGCLVGWCVEIIQAFFLIADDVMDQSETRRGKACWYKVVGLAAINDAVLLESLTFRILKRIVPHEIYLELSELVRQTIFQTELGQALDMNLPQKTDIADFCMRDYLQMVTYKTAYYTFVFPMQAAFILSGNRTKKAANLCETHKNTPNLESGIPIAGLEGILLRIGQLFQVQDDYLDCFGDVSVTGKIGTDIQDKKYSWLVVKAVELLQGDEEGLCVLRKNYGNIQGGEQSIQLVKQLYQKLNIEQEFKEWEEKVLNEIVTFQQSTDSLAAKRIIEYLCKTIMHRKK
jgi:farnesyl diphosphate synthase